MSSILINPSREVLIGLMFLASFRIFLEISGLKIRDLPLSKLMAKISSGESVEKFHRLGLIFAIGHILLFGPELLFY